MVAAESPGEIETTTNQGGGTTARANRKKPSDFRRIPPKEDVHKNKSMKLQRNDGLRSRIRQKKYFQNCTRINSNLAKRITNAYS